MEARIVQLETIIPTLATKADVESLRADLNKSAGELLADLNKSAGELRADLNKSAGELRADLNKSAGELRADFEKAQKENRTWMLATVLALFAGILGVGGFVVSTIKGVIKRYRLSPLRSSFRFLLKHCSHRRRLLSSLNHHYFYFYKWLSSF